MFEKNLSKEHREVMAEAKALVMSSVTMESMSDMDAEELVTSVKALRLVDRLINLCGDMFEKQEKLMDKMDKVIDNCRLVKKVHNFFEKMAKIKTFASEKF